MTSGPGLVVVGGGPAGLQTVKSYRESGGTESVTLLSRERNAPYRRPPLTKEFLRGETPASELPLEGPDWYERNGVEVRLETEVASLDVNARAVSLEDGEEIPYSRCVLATGSRPAVPPIPGADGPGVLLMRTIEDSEALIQASSSMPESGRCVVIGSGFIGCEAAASLAMRGQRVTMVSLEEAPQAARLGPEVAAEILSWLLDLGVEVRLGEGVEEIQHEDDEMAILTDRGELRANALLLGAGVEPNTEFAQEAGLPVSRGIICDSSMRTSDPRVFAAGDAAFAHNESAGRRLHVEHWGDALGQGRVCGETLAGLSTQWSEVPGFWSTIGQNTLKYASWGDGWDEVRFEREDSGAFAAWYGSGGTCVGVLAHERDEDYEWGRERIQSGAGVPE